MRLSALAALRRDREHLLSYKLKPTKSLLSWDKNLHEADSPMIKLSFQDVYFLLLDMYIRIPF